MIFEGETLFYLTYQTQWSAPYYGTLSGGIMKLNSTYQVEKDMLFGQNIHNTFQNIDVDLHENVYGLF